MIYSTIKDFDVYINFVETLSAKALAVIGYKPGKGLRATVITDPATVAEIRSKTNPFQLFR